MDARADSSTLARTVRVANPATLRLCALVFTVQLGWGLTLPMLPLFGRSFGVSYGAASLLISAWAFARLATDLVAGTVLDRLGTRITGVLALCVMGGASLATWSAASFPIAIICWAFTGVGSALTFAAFYKLLLGATPSAMMARTLGMFYASTNTGMILGGAISGVLAHAFGLRAPLAIYAGMLFLAGGLYIWLLSPLITRVATWSPEPGNEPPHAVPQRTMLRLFRNRGFATIMLLNFVYMWAFAAVFDTLVPFYGKDRLHLSTALIGVLFSLALAGELLALFPAASIADRRGRKVILIPALIALGAATSLIGWAETTALFAVGLIVLGAASGCVGVAPGAMLSDLQAGRDLSKAVGSFRFFGDFGLMAGPAVAGFAIKAVGFQGSFVIVALPIFAVTLLASRTSETLRRLTEAA